jgi:hypothetical protein
MKSRSSKLARVIIINDSFEIGKKENATLVNGVFDYVNAYEEIMNAIYNKLDLEVLTRDSTCFRWLSKLKTLYGSNYVEILENSPREAIKRKWHIKFLPKDVTDREILESGLLELKIKTKERENFENIILGNCYSIFLNYSELPIYNLVELLDDLVVSKWEEYKKKPVIFRQYKNRLNEWKDKRKEDEFIKIIEDLRNNPKFLQEKLMNYKVIKNYPYEIGERILGDYYDIFRKLPLDLNDLKVSTASIEKAHNEIEIYLANKVKLNDIEDIEGLLNILSGELYIEFDIIKKAIYDLEKNVTKDLIEKVKEKFYAISDQISTELKDLDLLIPPSKPSEPKDSWNAEEWINWAINEYLPYQFWLEERNKYDEESALFSAKFGEWFFDNFIKLKASFPNILHKILPEICYEIREKENIILFLMIDNFNYKYYKELENLFSKYGFFCKEPKAYFSMIPTETSVCKVSLFSGESEISNLDNRNYTKIIEQSWSGFARSKKFKFLPNLGTLNDVKKAEHNVYFLNHRTIDELFHQDEYELGKPHREEVLHRLDILVQTVINFIKRLGIEHKTSIYTCSDHGSTKIQAIVSNPIDRKYYNAKSENKHHRFVTLSDIQMENLPSHVESSCFVVHKKKYGLLENVLIARGYNRFKKTSGRYYVHGGLSPEEVIVPLATFDKIIAEPEKVLVNLTRKVFRYSVKSTIELEIGNLNDYEINNVIIDIQNSNIECNPLNIRNIRPKARVRVRIPAIFKKTADKREGNRLLARVRFQFLKKPYTQNIEIPITIKSMIEKKSDLEDFFN